MWNKFMVKLNFKIYHFKNTYQFYSSVSLHSPLFCILVFSYIPGSPVSLYFPVSLYSPVSGPVFSCIHGSSVSLVLLYPCIFLYPCILLAVSLVLLYPMISCISVFFCIPVFSCIHGSSVSLVLLYPFILLYPGNPGEFNSRPRRGSQLSPYIWFSRVKVKVLTFRQIIFLLFLLPALWIFSCVRFFIIFYKAEQCNLNVYRDVMYACCLEQTIIKDRCRT